MFKNDWEYYVQVLGSVRVIVRDGSFISFGRKTLESRLLRFLACTHTENSEKYSLRSRTITSLYTGRSDNAQELDNRFSSLLWTVNSKVKKSNAKSYSDLISKNENHDIAFNKGLVCTDFQEFKYYVNLAKQAQSIEEQIDHYKNAIKLYNDSLWREIEATDPLIAIKDFQKPFAETVVELARLLYRVESWNEATQTIERLIHTEPAYDMAFDLWEIALKLQYLIYWRQRKLDKVAEQRQAIIEFWQKQDKKWSKKDFDSTIVELLVFPKPNSYSDEGVQHGQSAENIDEVPPSPAEDMCTSINLEPVLPILARMPLIGRDKQVETVEQLLGLYTSSNPKQKAPYPLVTITGEGGIGKTHFVLHIADRVMKYSSRIPWYIPLENERSLPDPYDIIWRKMREQCSTLEASEDPKSQVLHTLSLNPSLLILDNVEQFAPHELDFIPILVTSVPQLSCMLTSRKKTKIDGEYEYPLLPLTYPKKDVNISLLPEYSAIELLFSELRRNGLPDLSIHHSSQDIVHICQFTGGIPLFIQLLIPQIKRHGIARVRTMLHDFDQMTQERPDNPARQKSIVSNLNWYWSLFNREEAREIQTLLYSLSIFEGPFTQDAAMHVCLMSSTRFNQLAEWYLVQRYSMDDTVLYRLLPPIREFGQKHIDPQQQNALVQCHILYYRDIVKNEYERETRNTTDPYANYIHLQYANIHAAMERCSTREEFIAEGQRFIGFLGPFWEQQHIFREVKSLCDRLLQHGTSTLLTDVESTWAWFYAGVAAVRSGDTKSAKSYFNSAVMAAEKVQTVEDAARQKIIANCTNALSNVLMDTGDLPTAILLQERVIKIWTFLRDSTSDSKEKSKSERALSQSLSNYGNALEKAGQWENALDLQQKSCEARRQFYASHENDETAVGDLAHTENNLANAYCGLKRFEEAETNYRNALNRTKRLQHINGHSLQAYSHYGLGVVALAQGMLEQAAQHFQQSYDIRVDLGEKIGRADCLHRQAVVAYFTGTYQDAEDTIEKSRSLAKETGNSYLLMHILYSRGCILVKKKEYRAAIASWSEANELMHRYGYALNFTPVEQNEHVLCQQEAEVSHEITD